MVTISRGSIVADLYDNLNAFTKDDVASNHTQARLQQAFSHDRYPPDVLSLCNDLDILHNELVRLGATSQEWQAVISLVSSVGLDPRPPADPKRTEKRLGLDAADSRTQPRERGVGLRYWEIDRS